jgi:hypothetical protein
MIWLIFNLHRTAFRRKLHGIGQKIKDQLLEFHLIEGHFDFIVVGFKNQGQFFLNGHRVKGLRQIAQIADYISIDQIQLQIARLQFREVQHLIDQLKQVFAVPGNELFFLFMPLNIICDAHDNGEGRSKFMRNIGIELGFDLAIGSQAYLFLF